MTDDDKARLKQLGKALEDISKRYERYYTEASATSRKEASACLLDMAEIARQTLMHSPQPHRDPVCKYRGERHLERCTIEGIYDVYTCGEDFVTEVHCGGGALSSMLRPMRGPMSNGSWCPKCGVKTSD